VFKRNQYKVRIGKNNSDDFRIQNGVKKGDHLLPLVLNFALEYVVENQEGF
jgi:hypothetical protein